MEQSGCLIICRIIKYHLHFTACFPAGNIKKDSIGLFNRCSKLILIQKQYLPAMYGKGEKNGEREREGVLGWGERLSLVLTKANQ